MIPDCDDYRNGAAFATASVRAWGIRLATPTVLAAVKADETARPARAAGMVDALLAHAVAMRAEGRL